LRTDSSLPLPATFHLLRLPTRPGILSGCRTSASLQQRHTPNWPGAATAAGWRACCATGSRG